MVLSFVLPGRTRYDVFRQLTLQASPQPTPNEYTLHLQRRSQSPSTPPSVTRVRAQGKNVEILHAVEDLIKIIRAHPLYDHLESVSEEEVTKLKKHYNHFMYQVRLRRDVPVAFFLLG